MEVKKVLLDMGLQESEIEIYLALLKSGESTATELSKFTGIHRTNVYDLVEKLKQKGIVGTLTKSNVKHFKALNPENLIEYIKEKEEKLIDIIPVINSIAKKSKENISVEILKGKQGIKNILNDIVKEGKDYLLFGHLKFEEILPYYIIQFMKKIDKLNITEHAILEEKTKIIPAKKNKYKYLPKKYLFPNATVVYSDKIAIFLWQEPYFIIWINSKDLAKSYKAHFNLLWEIAK
ncbi:MAG: TrmB family transcriptional regulator [Candidatus Woesearchaeota archaeon]